MTLILQHGRITQRKLILHRSPCHSIATAVINVEGSIPSSEDASGENIKCKLDRGSSPEYCNSPKCVHFVTQPSLDQREDDVSDIIDDIFGSNTNSNAVHYHKAMSLLAL
jgi:hypothetical protein